MHKKHKMKKIIFFMIVFIVLLNINISAQIQCGKAVVGAWDIVCNVDTNPDPDIISDSYCPENYGDWGSCQDNSYGGKCYPPDRDCPNYGKLSGTTYDVKPGTNIRVDGYAAGTIAGISGGNLNLLDSNIMTFAIIPCTGASCSLTDTSKTAPLTGGTIYELQTYKVQYVKNGIADITDNNRGRTLPLVAVSTLKKIVGQDQIGSDFQPTEPIKEKIGIPVTTSSELGITKIDLFLYEKDVDQSFKQVTPSGQNACAVIPCTGTDCNKMGTITYTPPYPTTVSNTFIWDSTVCPDNDYKVIAKVYDNRPPNFPYSDYEIIFTIDNPQGPDPSPLPGLLNLAFVKIKTWVLS